MVGPPGTGKSMLAQRLAGLLPPLAHDEALESAAILSVAGAFVAARWGQRVLRAPHHTASAAALVGGGSPPRPGEVSLAHHGVLFLDELPEFPRAALEALREPLETGRIVVSRAARQAEFPARFQLVAAMNPCPCGQLGNPATACRCTPDAVLRYQGADQRAAARPHRPAGRGAGGRRRRSSRPRPTASRARVVAERVRRRPGDRASPARARPTRELAGDALDRHCRLDAAGVALPAGRDDAARLVGAQLSPRAARRAHDRRPAASAAITTAHLAEAIQYRRVLLTHDRPAPGRGAACRPQGKRAARRLPVDPIRGRIRPASGSRGRAGSCSGSGRSVEVGVADAEPVADRRADRVDRGGRQVGVVGRVLAVVELELREAAVDLAAVDRAADDEVVRAPAVVGAVAVAREACGRSRRR